MLTRHVIVKGRVQGVFFRDYTKRYALQFNLAGWVRNLSDGSVEALFCGDEKMVSDMLSWLKRGSPQSRVDSVHINVVHSDESFSTFNIRY